MMISVLLGLIALLLGVFLVGYGIRSSQTFTDKVMGGITGHYTRRTMWYLISGVLLILLGGALIFLWGHGPILGHL